MSRRPQDGAEDEELRHEIEIAKSNLGLFIRRISESYEEDRVKGSRDMVVTMVQLLQRVHFRHYICRFFIYLHLYFYVFECKMRQ